MEGQGKFIKNKYLR